MKSHEISKLEVELVVKTNINTTYRCTCCRHFTTMELPYLLSTMLNTIFKQLAPYETIEQVKYIVKNNH